MWPQTARRGANVARRASIPPSGLAKAIKATVSAGLSVERVEIDRDGKIIVVIGTPNLDAANDNEWDSVQLGAREQGSILSMRRL